MKDFTFSDETFIPKRTVISSPSKLRHAAQRKQAIINDAKELKSFRFVNKGQGEYVILQMVAPGLT